MFGEPGKGDGQFDTPHGVWIDNRPGREASVVVADRANKRLQWFTLAGKHLKTLDGFLLPANIDSRGDVLLVPDLQARVTLLDKDDQVITHLGEDPEWRAQVLKDGLKLRGSKPLPDFWLSENDTFVFKNDDRGPHFWFTPTGNGANISAICN